MDDLNGAGPFTVFAPTDDVFAALPEGTLDSLLANPTGDLQDILLYHVASGNIASGDLTDGMTIPTLLEGKNVTIQIEPSSTGDGTSVVTVNGITVVTADIAASNGVIHVISGVLMPPKDIVDVAIENSDTFSTLVTAVQEAKLVDTLKSDGPFTVFAPTNTAFDALPNGTLATLLADPEGELKDILLYHVLDGEYSAASITDGLALKTVQGDEITFSIKDGGIVHVNDAKVVTADVDASNGIIHIIDKVLIPPTDEGDDTTSAAVSLKTLSYSSSSLFMTIASTLALSCLFAAAIGYDDFLL